jgi:hypothetical protein
LDTHKNASLTPKGREQMSSRRGGWRHVVATGARPHHTEDSRQVGRPLLAERGGCVRLGKAAGYPLTILPLAELVWRRPVGGIVRSEGYLPPAVQRLIDILKPELAARRNAADAGAGRGVR